MELVKVQIECSGITPLLQNKMPFEVLEGLRSGKKTPKHLTKGNMTPREECEKKVYVTQDGKELPYLPTENLLACLINAGQFVRLDGKRQMSTAKSTLLPAFLTLSDPYLLLFEDEEMKKPATWEVDMRQGRNPNGGEAVCCCRPRFDRWRFRANALIDTSEIAMATIRSLWDIAGRRMGLCDHRPQKKGTNGQFVVACWEVEKQKEFHAA